VDIELHCLYGLSLANDPVEGLLNLLYHMLLSLTHQKKEQVIPRRKLLAFGQ
jgi:hypothetical protein